MSELLAKFEGESFVKGAFPGLSDREGGFFRDGRNVVFTEFSVQPVAGQQLLFSRIQNATVAGLRASFISGTPTLFVAYLDSIYKWTSGTPSSVGSGYTGVADATSTAPATRWSMERWGTWMLATNGVDAAQVYKGTSFGALAGTTFSTAEIFARRTPFMLAFNTSNGGDRIEWCHDDDVETWTPSATNKAGNLNVRDLNGDIVCAKPLQNEVAFYTENEAGIVSFIGTPNWFGADVTQEGIGAVSKNAVAVVGNMHYGFGPRGIWRSDGLNHEYASQPAVHDFIFNTFNYAQRSKVAAWHDSLESCVVFWYPSTADYNDIGVRFNYRNGSWSIEASPRNLAEDSGAFRYGITADRFGDIYSQNVVGAPAGGVTANPVNMSSNIDFSVGYGYGGYGQGRFGGEWTVNG